MQIEIRGLTKQLGGVDILEDLNLTLESGQIVALLGANGAGKTTLLHLLGGLYQATSGEILIDGEPLKRERMDQRRRLHYLPDIPSLAPSQSPIEYIVFALEAYGKTGAVDDERVLELLSEFDMLPIADIAVRSLSRGQRYKATLIAMLAVDPELWIMDEPFTSGMDPIGLTAMRRHLFAARQRGRLIIYSTQLVEIAQQTSDAVCVLSASHIAAYGSVDSLAASAEHSPQLNDLLLQLKGDRVDGLE